MSQEPKELVGLAASTRHSVAGVAPATCNLQLATHNRQCTMGQKSFFWHKLQKKFLKIKIFFKDTTFSIRI